MLPCFLFKKEIVFSKHVLYSRQKKITNWNIFWKWKWKAVFFLVIKRNIDLILNLETKFQEWRLVGFGVQNNLKCPSVSRFCHMWNSARWTAVYVCRCVRVQTLVACICRYACAVAWRWRLPPYLESPPVCDRPNGFFDLVRLAMWAHDWCRSSKRQKRTYFNFPFFQRLFKIKKYIKKSQITARENVFQWAIPQFFGSMQKVLVSVVHWLCPREICKCQLFQQ